jgi:hypothetical protein
MPSGVKIIPGGLSSESDDLTLVLLRSTIEKLLWFNTKVLLNKEKELFDCSTKRETTGSRNN